MASTKKQTLQNTLSKSILEFLLKEYYSLRKNFEASYSGNLRSQKYEETREFTISLNQAIFEVNRLNIDENGFSKKSQKLKVKLKKLRNDFDHLLGSN